MNKSQTTLVKVKSIDDTVALQRLSFYCAEANHPEVFLMRFRCNLLCVWVARIFSILRRWKAQRLAMRYYNDGC